MVRVIYRNGNGFVRISKSDRLVAKRLNIKAPSKTIVSVDEYARFLSKVGRKVK